MSQYTGLINVTVYMINKICHCMHMKLLISIPLHFLAIFLILSTVAL